MLLGIVSDPHGNVYGLQAALTALDLERVDQIVCAGDVIGYYPFVNETIELLKQRSVSCIAGNHDLYLRRDIPVSNDRWNSYYLDHAERTITDENRAWLAALPLHREFVADGCAVSMHHGSPWSPEEYVYPDKVDADRFAQISAEVDVVVLGHTHIPLVRQIPRTGSDLLLLNPGSCGQPRDYNPHASCAVLDTATLDARIVRVTYNVQAVLSRCSELGFGAPVRDILTRTR